jgi:hypothetical protein
LEGGEDLARLRVASHLLLGEDEAPVRKHVELALLALDRDGVVPVGLQLDRETRGPFVVARSDGAVEDLDLHDTDSRHSGRSDRRPGCSRVEPKRYPRAASNRRATSGQLTTFHQAAR